MVPDVLHYSFKGNVHKEEKYSPNIYFEVLMKEKMATSADAHKKSSKEMCDDSSMRFLNSGFFHEWIGLGV